MSQPSDSGSQANALAAALISSSFDRDPNIKQVIMESLSNFGNKRPELALNAIHEFLIRHNKIVQNHRILLLHCIDNIVRERCSEIPIETAKQLIALASEDLTKSKKIQLELQTVCCQILVSLGMCFLSDVMDELLKKFVPGILPHLFVVKTLGNLAIANVNGMSSYIGKLLSTTLPLLSIAKQEGLRITFSEALFNFCESILEFVSNTSESGDSKITKTTFATEMYGAYDILYSSWLQTRDIKVVSAVVGALGKMCHLMELEKLEIYAPRLVTMLISLCRRYSAEPLALTTALCDVIAAISDFGSTVLEHNLDSLTASLHAQVCTTPDNASQSHVKNYNEVLRCLGILATSYSGILLTAILQKADSRDERVRSGNLVILRHLINSNPHAMDQHKDMIVTGFLGRCNDQSNKVKLNLAKLVVAMATHGYLLQEGGGEYVKFIVHQCSLSDHAPIVKDKVVPVVSNEQVRTVCDDILQLITTTVDGLDRILWPFLFEFVIHFHLMNSLGVVCRSLSHIAQNKRKEKADDLIIDFHHQVNIPSSVALFSRILVFLAHPRSPRSHPAEALQLLQNFSVNINVAIVDLWDEIIPKILAHWKENGEADEKWSQTTWEDLLLKFLTKSMDVVDDEEWTCSIGQALTSQWRFYDLQPQYKNFAYKCLGVVLRKAKNKEFVDAYLATLFLSVKHVDQREREGAAVCVGYCASSHLDMTLVRLNEFVKVNITKKESSYFNFLKSEKTLTDLENIKGTVALCCGYIAFYAPSELITSRIETNIIKTIMPLFKGIKDASIKVDLTNTVHLIGRSLDPNHFTTSPSQPRYVFAARDDVISKLLHYLKEDGSDEASQLKAAILKACASLVKLDPQMNDSDETLLLKQCIETVIPIIGPETAEEGASDDEVELLTKCTENLHDLLREVLAKKPTSAGLFSIFKHFEPFLVSEKSQARLRAFQTIRAVFKMYLQLFKVSTTNSALHCLGLLLARLIPCCCDEVLSLRVEAVACISELMAIQNKYNGVEDDGTAQDKGLADISNKLASTDTAIMYGAIVDLAKVLCLKIPSDQLQFAPGSLTLALIDALTWHYGPSAYAACMVLHHVVDTRGTMFSNKVEEITTNLLLALAHMTPDSKPYVRIGILDLFARLARHHLHSCVKSLLNHPLPFTDVVVSCWAQIGSSDLCTTAVDFLLDQLDRSLPYDEVLKRKGKPKEGSHKTATMPALSICCAINELLKVRPTSGTHQMEAANEGSYRVLATSLVRVGCMLDVKAPNKLGIDPYRQSVELLKTAFACQCDAEMVASIERRRVWSLLETRTWESFVEALSAIAGSFCKHSTRTISGLVSGLNVFLSSMYELQRATVVGVFAQLVKEPAGRDEVLLEIIMNSLRSKLIDSHALVKKLSIRGLANVIYTSHEQVERYSTSVLSAMMTGMDDKDDHDNTIALEAMSGLARFLNKVERTNVHSIFINVCLRVRPCFENDNPAVRVAAFRLFGALAKFGVGPSKDTFEEQVHSNFISILLHLNDEDPDVIKSCKGTLREIGPCIGSEKINDTFQKLLKDDVTMHYGEFMNSLSKIMIEVFPDKISFYIMGCVSFFKSQWSTLRSNAAMLTGFLMSNIDEEHRDAINKEHSCAALIQLLKDASPEVRGKAAEAISSLVQY